MKKFYSLVIYLVFIVPAFAQDTHEFSSVTGNLIRTTPKLKDIDKNSIYGEPFTITRDENGLVGVVKKTAVLHPNTYDSKYSGPDPLLNTRIPNGVTVASATIGANFDGLGFTSVNPSDPNCAVGPNHVIQTINNSSSSYFKIWNKAGTQVQAQLLISSLTGIQGSGDPVVIYDQLANRWLLTEFGRTPSSSTFINTLIMAVSVTDDPTGSWYIYSFVDNTFFVDFPKFSVWHNAYYATSNDFNTGATTYLGSSIYAFERSKMLTGDPTAVGIRTRLTDAVSGRYFSMAPVCLEGTATSSQSGLFAFFQDDLFTPGADVDSLFIFEFTPNFAVPASSVIGAFTKMEAAPFDSDICAVTRDQCVNQQGSGVALESLAGRLTHKVIYRNFGTHESIVANTSVDVGGQITGIRWWELRRPAATWGIYQEGTYSPDANHRWLGGICMDALGNIGLMYNVSGTTAFPSIRFTGRNPCDALGTMTLPETVIINGTVANASTRYGDYGTLAIDPSTNRDFWLTAQYNAATTWSTRLATFRLNNCAPLPKIRFDSAMKAYREADATTSLTTCQNYKDYVVNVVIDAAPSQPAIVTFATSGTATNGSGRDYTITPATVTLDAGNLTRAVTIRVFDDNALEGNESFTISYSINNSGGNAAADVYNQTCLINIIDNDVAPVASRTVVQTWGAANVATLISGPFSGLAYTDKRIQHLYLASDLIAAGFTPGNITEFAWNFNSATVATYNNLNLDIGFTNATSLSGFITPVPAFTSIFSGNFTTPGVTSWRNFVLPTPVAWNGTDNIVIQTCWDNTAVSADVSLIGSTPSAVVYTALERVNTPGAGTSVCASVATSLSASRPDIRLKMISPVNTVATVLNTSKTANLGPLDDVYFYDATGKIMARIKNLTAFDYGCTQIQIDRAGSTSAQFWNNNTTNYLASKSFKVIPTNNTATGHYQITLYYTNAEVTGWQTATGLSWGAAQMAKVSNGFFIPDVTTATPHTVDVSIMGTSQLAYGTDNTITGDFNNTGFSGFGVGVPASPLPVTIVYFNGYQKNNYGILEWRTAAEYNNKGFELEKSFDGINYFKIGFVDGAGTSSVTNNYLFTDKTKLTNVQYYRLKQIDFDARAVVSNTIVLKSDSREILDLLSVTNPFKTTINMLFTKPLTQTMNIELFDITGKKVFSTTRVPGTLSLIEFSVADKLNKGNYILKVTTGDQQFVKKLVKL